MQQQLNLTINEIDDRDDSSLLDCYRIALDFGMPAALKAYEKLTLKPSIQNNNSSVNNNK